MNKTAFIGATAIVVVATVAGYKYRHVALEQLDKWLHPRFQDPESEDPEDKDPWLRATLEPVQKEEKVDNDE